MRKALMVVLLTGATGLLGCENNKDQSEVATAPPPPVDHSTAAPPVDSVTPPAAKPVPIAPEPAGGAAAAAKGKTYTVQPKDTIFSIARKVYGDEKKAKEIIALNKLADPNRITVGQVLQLP